jgi:hypothetical protein
MLKCFNQGVVDMFFIKQSTKAFIKLTFFYLFVFLFHFSSASAEQKEDDASDLNESNSNNLIINEEEENFFDDEQGEDNSEEAFGDDSNNSDDFVNDLINEDNQDENASLNIKKSEDLQSLSGAKKSDYDVSKQVVVFVVNNHTFSYENPDDKSKVTYTYAKGDPLVISIQGIWAKIENNRFIKMSSVSTDMIGRDPNPNPWLTVKPQIVSKLTHLN